MDPLRAAPLAQAPNAQVVRRRRDGRIVQINLFSFTDDYKASAIGEAQEKACQQLLQELLPKVALLQ